MIYSRLEYKREGLMNTCENCYFWHPENPSDEAAQCIVDPPRVIPIMGMKDGKPHTILQNVYPTTTRDVYCHRHDAEARAVLKLVQRLPPVMPRPGEN
jgi:hypothetical protein